MAAPPSLLDEEGQPGSGSPLQIGQVVCAKYRIERQIGRGGMGIVLAATHLHLGHLVALKVMRRDLVADDRALERLLSEARAAAGIRSEHVARVLDVGMLESGSPFIVMEYLEGENLADLLDRQGALEIEQAASFLMQCCLALAEVHVADMVHRDLKPGNIFIARQLDGSPTVKIVDFGISKHIGDARERGATTSQVLGSPFYMAPEQMRAEGVDERSDIWGLGAILFEMLTGRPPFLGDTLPEVYAAVLNQSPPHVDALRPGVPPGLDDVVQRCLEKDPSQRFCDVADLAEALAPYAGSMAQAVERVTRILMNPEAARPRYSPLPGGGDAGIERLSVQVPSVGLGASDWAKGEGSMGSSSGGSDPSQRAPGGLAPTMLESEARRGSGPPPLAEPWRPSRPGNTGELASLAATGARVRALRGGRGRSVLIGVAGGAAAVTALALFWPRGAPPEPSAPQAGEPAAAPVDRPAPEPAPEPTPEPTPELPATPRVTPLEPSPRQLAAPAVETRALRPQPEAKPVVPPAASRPSPSRATDPSSALWSEPVAPREPEPVKRLESEEPAPAAGARRPFATPDDAWNPDAFGDRR